MTHAPSGGFLGADVTAVERVADRAAAGADRLGRLAARIQASVVTLRATGWFTGGASVAYADHLETVVLPWLQATRRALVSAAGAVRRQADEQRTASGSHPDGRYATPTLPPGDCRTAPCGQTAAARAGTAVDVAGGLVGAAGLVLERVDDGLITDVRAYRRADGTVVRGHVRWRQGYAATMSVVGSAAVWRAALDHPASVAGRRLAPWAFAAADQTLDDWDDASLSRGDRVARTGAAVALRGGGGVAGGLAGAAGGAAIGAAVGSVVPVVGTTIGGVIGGIAGGLGLGAGGSWLGGQVQEHVLDDVIDRVGDGLDRWFDEEPTIDHGGGGR